MAPLDVQPVLVDNPVQLLAGFGSCMQQSPLGSGCWQPTTAPPFSSCAAIALGSQETMSCEDEDDDTLIGLSCLVNGACEVGAALLLSHVQEPPSTPRFMDSQEFSCALAGLQASIKPSSNSKLRLPAAVPTDAALEPNNNNNSAGSINNGLGSLRTSSSVTGSLPATSHSDAAAGAVNPNSKRMTVRVVLKTRRSTPPASPPLTSTPPGTDAVMLPCDSLLNDQLHTAADAELAAEPQPSNSCGSSPSLLPTHVAAAALPAAGAMSSMPYMEELDGLAVNSGMTSVPVLLAKATVCQHPLRRITTGPYSRPSLPPLSLPPLLAGREQVAQLAATLDLPELDTVPPATYSSSSHQPILGDSSMHWMPNSTGMLAYSTGAALLQPMPAKRRVMRLNTANSAAELCMNLPEQQCQQQQDQEQVMARSSKRARRATHVYE